MRMAEDEGHQCDLSDLNTSLAQTYIDMEDYVEAHKHFTRQLKFEASSPESACKTYSQLANLEWSKGVGVNGYYKRIL